MGKIKYKKCPRCELNYIPDTEEMCDICKAELGLETDIVLLDDIIDDDEPLKLCPICKTAYIGLDEDMCENCLAQESRGDELDEDSDDWREYLDDDDAKDSDEDGDIPLDELDKEFGDDEEEDEEFEDEENMDIDLDDYPDDLVSDFDDEDYDDEDESDDLDDDL